MHTLIRSSVRLNHHLHRHLVRTDAFRSTHYQHPEIRAANTHTIETIHGNSSFRVGIQESLIGKEKLRRKDPNDVRLFFCLNFFLFFFLTSLRHFVDLQCTRHPICPTHHHATQRIAFLSSRLNVNFLLEYALISLCPVVQLV